MRKINSGKSVLCGNLEEWDGVGGGREVRGVGGHTYTYGWFMLMYGRSQHNIAKQLSSRFKKNKD